MRGLDVRVEYALAKIEEFIDPNTDAMCLALYEAEAEGGAITTPGSTPCR